MFWIYKSLLLWWWKFSKKDLNGKYPDYITVKESNNIIFNLNDTKKEVNFFISDYSSICSFFSNNEEYLINGYLNDLYYLFCL